MAWFVKTEIFTAVAAALPLEQRRPYIEAHRQWVQHQKAEGRMIYSGFLVDDQSNPGGGGLLIFYAENYKDAHDWIANDPLIRHELVDWKLQEWILITQ